jgi:hypothetical protein
MKEVMADPSGDPESVRESLSDGGKPMKARTSLAVVVSALVGAIAFPGLAAAQRPAKNFGAHLTGDQEVPPRVTDATGQATFRLLRSGNVAFRLIVDDIENVFAAHIHCGDPGVNMSPLVTLYSAPPGGGPVEGVLATGTFDPDDFECTFNGTTVDLLAAMRAGRTYTNVHTDDGDGTPNEGPGDFPGGEIRGQNLPRGGGA